MNAIKRHPIFSAWIFLCVFLVIGDLYWTHLLRQRVRREQGSLAQKTREKDQLLEITRSRLEDFAKPQAVSVAALTPSPVDAIPRGPLDAFIEIASTKDALRRLAAEHQVVVPADESFGFASHAHEGPQENQLIAVHRQLGLIQLLVEKLFAARPSKLIAVQREPPDLVRHDGTPESAPDFFPLDPRLDLRVADVIEGRAVRLEFTGPTRVLRSFLNSLAEAPEPLVVRSVEAEPLQTGSKFAVVVEQIESVGLSGLAGMTSGRAEALALWSAPHPSGGTNPSSDLFDSPEILQSPQIAAAKIEPTDRVELVAVKREPYRLQLVGYFGAMDNYTGTFVSPGSPETLFARVGHHFESLGLALRKLGVETRAGPFGDEVTPVATLWDERTQQTITLVGRARLLTDTPLAILRLAPLPAKPREFRTGATFRDSDGEWFIERIQLNPAEVVIVRQSPAQPSPERQVLRPAMAQFSSASTDLVAADHTK